MSLGFDGNCARSGPRSHRVWCLALRGWGAALEAGGVELCAVCCRGGPCAKCAAELCDACDVLAIRTTPAGPACPLVQSATEVRPYMAWISSGLVA